MQDANKKTGKLPKKLKLITSETAIAKADTNKNSNHDIIYERSVVDKTSSCEPVRDDPTTGPATLEITSNPTATEPNIMEPQELLGERGENDGVIAGSTLASPVDDDSGIPGSDISAITHADGLAILDEYFPKSATGLGPLSGVLVPEPRTPPARVALPGSPGVWTTPSAGPDVEFPKEPEIPYPERAIDSVEKCGSISYSGSPRSISSCINPTRCPSCETNATDIDSLDIVIHPPFTKREDFLAKSPTSQLSEERACSVAGLHLGAAEKVPPCSYPARRAAPPAAQCSHRCGEIYAICIHGEKSIVR
jgi:hypothetical protein